MDKAKGGQDLEVGVGGVGENGGEKMEWKQLYLNNKNNKINCKQNNKMFFSTQLS